MPSPSKLPQSLLLIQTQSSPDETNLNKIKNSLKHSIYGVLYTLTKDLNTHFVLIVILSIIETCQFFAFSFHPVLQSSWNSKTNSRSNAFYTAFIKLHFVNYFLNSERQFPYLLLIYFFLLLLLVMIALIIYIAYSFNRGFFSLSWPISLLRMMLTFLLTIIYLPLLRLYLSIYQCDSETNNNFYINSMKCFSDYHFIHVVLGGISIIILFVISWVGVICFYQNYNYSFNSNNNLNDVSVNNIIDIHKNSDCDKIKFFVKTVLAITFTFIYTHKDISYSIGVTAEWVIIIILNVFSIYYFLYVCTKQPYLNSYLQTFHSTLSAVYAWLNACLAFTKFIKYLYNYEGGVYFFITGTVLIIIVMIFNMYLPKEDKLIKAVNININHNKKGAEIQKQLYHMIELITTRAKSRENEMILRGAIKTHENVCIFNDCPLKLVKNSFISQIDVFTKSTQVTTILLNFVNRVYTKGISRFPNCIDLRIDYILFLFVYQKQRLKALSEIEGLMKHTLSFEKEFIVFKIKRMILDVQDNTTYTSINANKKGVSSLQVAALDIIDNEASIAYESHYRQCQNTVLVSSKLFLDFWSMLSNSNNLPDIFKLNSLGEKINDCLKNIDNHWNRMQHYKPNDFKALKFYSSFVAQILNNKEKAKEILALAKGNNYMYNHNIIQKIENEYKDELVLGNGIICISAENENFGTILKATGNISKLFGYLLSDILGRNIDDFFIEGYNGYVSYYIKTIYQRHEGLALLEAHKANNNNNNNKNINSNNNNNNNNINTNNIIIGTEEKLFYNKSHSSLLNPLYLTVLSTQAVNEKLQIKILIRSYAENIKHSNNNNYNDNNQLMMPLQSSNNINAVNVNDNMNNLSKSKVSKFDNRALFLVNSNLTIMAYNEDASILIGIVHGKLSHDNFNLAFYFPELLHDDISYNPNIHYRIIETVLIDMFIENANNANSINNEPVVREVYFTVRNNRKSRRIPGTFNFFHKETNVPKKKPLFTKVKIETIDDLNFIKKYDGKGDEIFQQFINATPSSTSRVNTENNGDNKSIGNNDSNSFKGIGNIDFNIGHINYDSLLENIKDTLFVVSIEYSIEDKVEYGKCGLNVGVVKVNTNNNNNNVLTVNTNTNVNVGNSNSIHKNFSYNMIENPYLKINIDSILDEILLQKKLSEDFKASLSLIENTNVNVNNKNTNSSSENITTSKKQVHKRKHKHKTHMKNMNNTSFNLMSYLSDKTKFGKLYSFEGIDLMELIDDNLHSTANPNLNHTHIKTMTNNKKDEHKKQQQQEQLQQQQQLQQLQQQEQSPRKEKENSPSKQINNNNSSHLNSEDNHSLSENNNINNTNSIVNYQESKNLLMIYSALNLTQLRTKIEQLKDYSQNIALYVNQNDDLTTVKPSKMQVCTFLKIQESNLISQNSKDVFANNNTSNTNNNNTNATSNNDLTTSSHNKKVQNTKTSGYFSKNQKQNKNLKSLSHLQIVSLITVIMLVIFNIINFILNLDANNKTVSSFELVNYSYIAIKQIVYSIYLLRNLLLTKHNTYSNYLYENDLSSFTNLNIQSLTTAQKELDNIITEISNSGLKLLKEHDELMHDQKVPVSFLTEEGHNYSKEHRTLIQALSDMRIYILTIANYPEQSLYNNTLVNNLMFNCFNDFLHELKRSANLYSNLVLHNDKTFKITFSIMFAIVVVIAFVEIIIMSKCLIKVDSDRTKILCAFYEIPQEYVHDLSKKCIKFIEKNEKIKNTNANNNNNNNNNPLGNVGLQPHNNNNNNINQSENDGDDDGQDSNEENENDELLNTNNSDEITNTYENIEDRHKKHQRIKNILEINKKENRKTLIKVFIIFLLVVCVFILDYTKNMLMFNDMDKIVQIFNTTAQAESQYIYSLNLEREKILNHSFITFNSPGLFTLNTTLQDNYNLNNKFLIHTIKSSGYFSEDFVKKMNTLLNGNVCEFINDNNKHCENGLDQLGLYGGEVITIRFFEMLRLGTKKYIKKRYDGDLYVLLSGELFTNMTIILHYYICPIYQLLREETYNNIKHILKNEMNFRLIVFIVFLVVVTVVYLIIWIPKQNSLNDEIIRTKKLLEIIPSEILDKIDSLKQGV